MKKFILTYFFFLMFFLSIFASGVVDSQDGLQYLAVARNIYYTGKPTAPIYEYKQEKNIHMSTFVGKDGNTYSPTGLGYSVALVPAVFITDIFYKLYNISPPVHFPLENDWLILLTASMTNSFFGALLGVILYVYFINLKLSHKQALFMSLVSILATNLFIYSKHTWAHMMFTTFLTLTFLMLRLFASSKKRIFLIFAGGSFGTLAITYNQTFLLTIPALIVFYLMFEKAKLSLKWIKRNFLNGVWFFIGSLPFLSVLFWYDSIRAIPEQNLNSVSFYSSYATYKISTLPLSILFEGIWGQLFSPGRSIFIYTPLLLTIVFFWIKIKSQVKPELLGFLTLSLVYILFYAAQFTYGGPTEGYAALWAGESSWGPRYLVPLLPLGMVIVGFIYKNLSKFQKNFIFYPLIIIGIYIQSLGLIMPFQIKYHDLEGKFYINNTEFTHFYYPNLYPRYSPIFMMSKKLIKNFFEYPKTLDHGLYNVRFFDGIDFAFNVGPERWRVIEGKGYISFDNLKNRPVKKISFGVINHPLKASSESAQLNILLNGEELNSKPLALKVTQRELFEIPIPSNFLKEKGNLIEVGVQFSKPDIIEKRKQLLGLISFAINEKTVNMETIDFPYYSALGPAMVNAKYNIYGGKVTNQWRFWEMHTQVYERTPDFWWIRTFYYWDYPKTALNGFFLLIFLLTTFLGVKTFTYSEKLVYKSKRFGYIEKFHK